MASQHSDTKLKSEVNDFCDDKEEEDFESFNTQIDNILIGTGAVFAVAVICVSYFAYNKFSKKY